MNSIAGASDTNAKGHLGVVAASVAAVGAGALAYSLIEARQYRLRQARVPMLHPGQQPLSILHMSDLHLTPRQHGKREWIEGLADLSPDMVVVTGDFLAHPGAVGPTLRALGPLLSLPGAFVLGSNDYYSPRMTNPLKYLARPSGQSSNRAPDLPWGDLVDGLTAAGWADLSNVRATLKVGNRIIDTRGVDDPHIGRDYYSAVAGDFNHDADIRLGVVHAPYRRVLDAMAADGAGIILAGHTHGGQVCLPGFGALVTNCDIDRTRAKGLHRHGNAWLHVSAGLGTSPYAPIRFACPPEATLLTLVPKAVYNGH